MAHCTFDFRECFDTVDEQKVEAVDTKCAKQILAPLSPLSSMAIRKHLHIDEDAWKVFKPQAKKKIGLNANITIFWEKKKLLDKCVFISHILQITWQCGAVYQSLRICTGDKSVKCTHCIRGHVSIQLHYL